MTADQHTFQVGEVVEWQNLDGKDSVCNGQECTVIGPMEWAETTERWTDKDVEGFGYVVRDSEGKWFAMFWELRKKPPKQRQREKAMEECA